MKYFLPTLVISLFFLHNTALAERPDFSEERRGDVNDIRAAVTKELSRREGIVRDKKSGIATKSAAIVQSLKNDETETANRRKKKSNTSKASVATTTRERSSSSNTNNKGRITVVKTSVISKKVEKSDPEETLTETSDSDIKKIKVPTVTVDIGETLSAIAVRVYGSKDKYLDLYKANRGVLKSPNDIRAGQILKTPNL